MKLFLYEYACAQSDDVAVPESVRREGRAMFDAVLEDARKLTGLIEVISQNSALTTQRSCHEGVALIIAPEFDGILERLVRQARDAGWKLLGPSPEAIRLTADKWHLYQHWKLHQVPTPETLLVSDQPTRVGRYLIKHRWGAGSLGVQSWEQGMQCDEKSIIQEHHEGIPVSLAFLVDLNGKTIPLWPAYQHISTDGSFQYLGGSLVQNPKHRDRIIRLATSAIRDIPGLFGYVGVDALLNDTVDVVLEVNPRLTTSYLGLRQATTVNLLGSMLASANGEDFSIDWINKGVNWDASGNINTI